MLNLAKSLPVAALILLLGGALANSATKNATFWANTASTSLAPTTNAPKSDTLSDTLVIPGQRVGPVTRNTTRQDLVKRFGTARLTDQSVNMGEGFTQPGTRVNLGPNRSFSVVWSDTTRTKPVEVRNLGSAWRTPQGIGVGTPFAQLQRKLGRFELYGFGWDYSGTVLLRGSQLAQYDKTLILRLRPAPGAAEKAPNDYRAVLGDGTFSSTNPHLPPLRLQVGEMIVRLAPEGR